MIHSWPRNVTNSLQLFSVVHYADVREDIIYRFISLNTSKKYMFTLTSILKQNITSRVSDRFVIALNGHTTTEGHYVHFCYVSFCNFFGYCSVCLAASPLEDRTIQDTDENIHFLKLVLNVFEKAKVMLSH